MRHGAQSIGTRPRGRVTRSNARSAGRKLGDRFCLSGGVGQENVTLPREHPIFHALFYPQMY